jgi:hypothetical protein
MEAMDERTHLSSVGFSIKRFVLEVHNKQQKLLENIVKDWCSMREEKTFEITLPWFYARFVVSCEGQKFTTHSIY